MIPIPIIEAFETIAIVESIQPGLGAHVRSADAPSDGQGGRCFRRFFVPTAVALAPGDRIELAIEEDTSGIHAQLVARLPPPEKPPPPPVAAPDLFTEGLLRRAARRARP